MVATAASDWTTDASSSPRSRSGAGTSAAKAATATRIRDDTQPQQQRQDVGGTLALNSRQQQRQWRHRQQDEQEYRYTRDHTVVNQSSRGEDEEQQGDEHQGQGQGTSRPGGGFSLDGETGGDLRLVGGRQLSAECTLYGGTNCIGTIVGGHGEQLVKELAQSQRNRDQAHLVSGIDTCTSTNHGRSLSFSPLLFPLYLSHTYTLT